MSEEKATYWMPSVYIMEPHRVSMSDAEWVRLKKEFGQLHEKVASSDVMADEIRHLRAFRDNTADTLRETASSFAAITKEHIALMRERDRAMRGEEVLHQRLETAIAQRDAAYKTEATMRSAYLPVLAQAKIAADFQEALERIAVMVGAEGAMALTELPDFFATIVAPALPPDWASGAEEYFTRHHNQRGLTPTALRPKDQ